MVTWLLLLLLLLTLIIILLSLSSFGGLVVVVVVVVGAVVVRNTVWFDRSLTTDMSCGGFVAKDDKFKFVPDLKNSLQAVELPLLLLLLLLLL